MPQEDKTRAETGPAAAPADMTEIDPDSYPLVDPNLLKDLASQGARDPARMKYTIAEILGRNSMRTAIGEKEPEAMRQLEQAAGELLRRHPEPVPLVPEGDILTRMRDAARRASQAATRHREYDGDHEELRENSHQYRPADPSHYGVTVGLRFDKNGRTMMVNPHKTDSDYDHPEMTREGRDFLAKALTDAAQQAGLELGAAVTTVLQADEKGWVTIGYNWTSSRQ